MTRAAVWFFLSLFIVLAQPADASSPLDRLAFLAGEWSTDTDTELGHAAALSAFTISLDRHILERRGSTKYTSGKLAGTQHDDLLIVYVEGPNGGLKAIYFDGEGHVIHYAVTIPLPGTARFESDPGQPGPRYRLTHRVTGNRMDTKFEIALPGQNDYQTYVSGVSTKK